MAKAGQKSMVGGGRADSATRERLVDAAFETLRELGFAQTSARAIAQKGDFNPALIFYYFDSLNDLLIEALARSGRSQLEKYQQALGEVNTLQDLVVAVQDHLRDDMLSGHLRVLAELVGASSSDDELNLAVLPLVRPWIEFTAETLERVLASSGISGLMPRDQIAFAIVSLLLGMELLSGLVQDETVARGLFESAERIATLVTAVFPPEPNTLHTSAPTSQAFGQ